MYGFLLVFFSKVVPKTRHFWDIRLVSIVTLKPGLVVTQSHRKLYQSIRHHDFLLTFHSNHRPITHRFRDKRRYPSKIANFPTPGVFNAPDKGVPLGIWYRHKGSQKLKRWGYQMVEKSFKIGSVVLIQYWLWPDTQPTSHVAVASTALTASRW